MKIKIVLLFCVASLLTACDSSNSGVPQVNEPPASIALPKAPLC